MAGISQNARARNNDDIDETIREALLFVAGRLAGRGESEAAQTWANNANYFKDEIRIFMQRRHTIRKKATR